MHFINNYYNANVLLEVISPNVTDPIVEFFDSAEKSSDVG